MSVGITGHVPPLPPQSKVHNSRFQFQISIPDFNSRFPWERVGGRWQRHRHHNTARNGAGEESGGGKERGRGRGEGGRNSLSWAAVPDALETLGMPGRLAQPQILYKSGAGAMEVTWRLPGGGEDDWRETEASWQASVTSTMRSLRNTDYK